MDALNTVLQQGQEPKWAKSTPTTAAASGVARFALVLALALGVADMPGFCDGRACASRQALTCAMRASAAVTLTSPLGHLHHLSESLASSCHRTSACLSRGPRNLRRTS